MKVTSIAAAVLVAGTPLFAEDGWSVGGTVDTEYKVDAESLTMMLEPEVKYTMGATALSASTDIPVWNSLADESFVMFDALEDGTHPDLDLEITHQLQDNLELSLGTAWDFNKSEREEITFGVSFSF